MSFESCGELWRIIEFRELGEFGELMNGRSGLWGKLNGLRILRPGKKRES